MASNTTNNAPNARIPFMRFTLAVVMAAALLARAYDTTWIASGQPISAAKLKADLDERRVGLPRWRARRLSARLSVGQSPLCLATRWLPAGHAERGGHWASGTKAGCSPSLWTMPHIRPGIGFPLRRPRPLNRKIWLARYFAFRNPLAAPMSKQGRLAGHITARAAGCMRRWPRTPANEPPFLVATDLLPSSG